MLYEPNTVGRGAIAKFHIKRDTARTGCQWDAIPKDFGGTTTCYERFREWQAAGVFEAFHAAMVRYYHQEVGVDLNWCSMDSASVKAPKGGTSRAPIRPIVENSAQNAIF